MSYTAELIVVAVIWALVAAGIAFFIPKWWTRVAFVILAVGIPFWELPYGYFNFQKLCKEEARLLVFEKIAPQKVVCADYPFVTLHMELLKAGFTIVETRGETGYVKRYESTISGSGDGIAQARLTSTYCMTFVNNNHLPWRILRHDVLIKRVGDGRVVARQSRFNWAGMWWQEEARPVLGGGGECSDDPDRALLALLRGAS